MALFTGRDKDLPLLTQFYQVDIPQGWRDDPSRLLDSELYDLVVPPVEIANTFMPAGWTKDDFLKTLTDVIEIHEDIVHLMDAMADGKELPAQFLRKILDYIKRGEVYFDLSFGIPPDFVGVLDKPAHVSELPDAFMVPTDQLFLCQAEDGNTVFATAIIRELKIFLASYQRPLFRRCESCASAFLLGRQDAKFCSWRCYNRERVRRYRSKSSLGKGLGLEHEHDLVTSGK